MYSNTDKHCIECICQSCDFFQTSYCIEGEDCCDRCDNSSHAGSCPWNSNEIEV